MQPIVPSEYVALREGLGFDEVSLGVGGVKLLAIAEIPRAQIGYSVSPGGKSLCDGSSGSWNPAWIVIGIETCCGDPIILNTSDTMLPVMTAMHGEGSWQPYSIAKSIRAFTASVREVKRIEAGRENPVEMESNPLPAGEKTAILHRIDTLNDNEIDLAFWDLLLGG